METIHLLVFEMDAQLYGVDVEQVEAIVDEKLYRKPGTEDAWTYQGHEVAVQNLAEWAGLDAPGGAPSRLLISQGAGSLRGFLADTPRDVVALPLDEVFAIPILIRRSASASPLWAVGRLPTGLILLVDLGNPPPKGSGPGRRKL